MADKIALTTDAVIFATKDEKTVVLLIRRKNPPFRGQWALPGGFLEADETLKAGCHRELKEESGLETTTLTRVGIYDKVDRDPRGRMISVAFTKVLDTPKKVKGADDAAHAEWMAVDGLENLAFDHEQIIKDALRIVKDHEVDSKAEK